MKNIFAHGLLVGLNVLWIAAMPTIAQAQIPAANVTGGPKSATYLPEAHKRSVRAQQKEDDRKREAELTAQKKAGTANTENAEVDPSRANKDR